MSERGFWWHAWPYAIVAALVGGGAVTGAVVTDGDPKAVGVGVAAVAATGYAIWRRIRGWP